MVKITRLREILLEALWIAPVFGVIGAAGLASLTIRLDEGIDLGRTAVIGFNGDAISADSILSTIATSMLSFLALVFTLTVIALQLATGFSPRLLRSFLTDRTSKLALAIFVATFAYAILILRSLNEDEVPELSVTVAIVLVIVSVIVFVYYVSEIAQSLRVANLVKRAGNDARREIMRAYTDGEPGSEDTDRREGWRAVSDRGPDEVLGWPGAPGVVTAVDLEGFSELARHHDLTIELRFQVGDFLPFEAPVLAVYGATGKIADDEIEVRIGAAPERTFRQDAAFGIRQLVDIASRALSPGVNDPTTAVQAIDQIHDLLIRLGLKRLYSGVIADEGGTTRVLAPVHTWNDLVRLGVEEIRIYSADSIQVARRLRAMLGDLGDRLAEPRLAVIEQQTDLLLASIDENFPHAGDRERAKAKTTSVGASEGGAPPGGKGTGGPSRHG